MINKTNPSFLFSFAKGSALIVSVLAALTASAQVIYALGWVFYQFTKAQRRF